MQDRQDDSADFSLPDFSGGGSPGSSGVSGGPAGGPGPSGPTGPAPQGPGGGGSRRGLWLALGLGGAGLLLVILVVVGLVLSQTVLSGGEDPTAGGDPSTAQEETDDEERTRGEYIPSEEETTQPEPEQGPTMTVAPSTECTLYAPGSDQEQPEGEMRGGGLSIPLPSGWERLSGSAGQQPHLEDSESAWTPVEAGWYTAVTVGRVAYPEEAGGYPGADAAARHLFECSITRDDSAEVFTDQPQVSEIHEEATTVDGHPAHLFEATVAITGETTFESTDSWRYAAIVVETPGGPSAFVGGAATGHGDQMQDLEDMKEGLSVTD